MPKTLYICYFGVREPLVQTQVLPYLRELMKGVDEGPLDRDHAGGGIGVSLLTFEPTRGADDVKEFERLRAAFAAEGIEWDWLPYHKRPSAMATAWDILRGTIKIWKWNRVHKFDVFHCRVHVPGVMAGLARKFSRHKPKIIFDIRGFFPEEFVDAGIWPPGGIIFRTAKRVEKWLIRESDAFVVLTEKAREILFPESKGLGTDQFGRPVEVIPCCVDFDRFEGWNENRISERARRGIEGRRVFTYIGSFGGWYLSDEMADLMYCAKKVDPANYFLILTQRDVEKVTTMLLSRGFGRDDFSIENVPAADVGKVLPAADIAMSFIKPTYSKQSSSPTKIAEYLACGLPIIANVGVGDVDELIAENRVGVLVGDLSETDYPAAIENVLALGDIRSRCRETARREFDLHRVAGVRYRRLYGRLLTSDKVEE